jgi:hypothetical protein
MSYKELDGWAEYERALFTLLEPFPDARIALVAGLMKLDKEDE